MREQKYARVLEEYEEKLKKSRKAIEVSEEVEDDDQLLMTRQIKYKELQEAIDDDSDSEKSSTKMKSRSEKADNASKKEIVSQEKEESSQKEERVEDILENTDHLKALEEMTNDSKKKEEDTKLEEKKEDNTETKKDNKENTDVKIEQVSGNSNLDDLYLTTSFQPLRKRLKFSKVFKKTITFIVILVAILGVGYFGIYPLAQKYLFNTPKKIFENTIDYLIDEANKIIPSEDKDNKEIESLLYKFDINLNTDIEGTEILTDYNYSFDVGMDFKQNSMLVNASISNDKDNFSYSMYQKKNNLYTKYSTDEKYMLINDNSEEIDNGDIQDYFNSLFAISTSDLKYEITTELSILKSLLDDKYLSREKDEITIDGKAVEVTRNTLEIDKNVAVEIEKKYYEKIKKDKKLLEILAVYEDMTVSEYEDYIDSIEVDENYDDDFKAAINIYTIKGSKFVGFDYEENGFREVYYYTNENEFDFYANLTDDEVCHDGMDCAAEDKIVIQATGEKKDNETEVVVKLNNKKIATLNVRTFTEELIDLDYEISSQGVYFTGTLKIEGITNNEKSSIYLKVIAADEFFIEINIDIEEKYNCDIDSIKEGDYVPYSDDEFTKREEAANKKLDEMGILDIINESIEDEETPPPDENTENLYNTI